MRALLLTHWPPPRATATRPMQEVAEWKAALEQGLEAVASAPDALAHADSDLEASFDEDSINYGTTTTTI